MAEPSPWWDRGRHRDRRGLLMARARIRSAIRSWFEAQGFVEVEPGCLQVSPGNEAHLHAFRTEAVGTDLSRCEYYLHTSPEFAMKKLLAAGEKRIFAFAPCFRNRERGPLHAPEFTMLEWYRTDVPYRRLWDDCAAILALAARETGRATWTWRDVGCDAAAPAEPISFDEAFARLAGFNLSETYDAAGVDRHAVGRRAEALGIKIGPDFTWSDIVSFVLTDRIERKLGAGRPAILHAYPVHEAALARPDPESPQHAERFELYVAGVELANGFGELNDASEQRRRFGAEMAEKQRRYGERYPIDEDFIAALAHMPPASGCAMGFDRLVMLATGASHIDQVLWTPLPGDGA